MAKGTGRSATRRKTGRRTHEAERSLLKGQRSALIEGKFVALFRCSQCQRVFLNRGGTVRLGLGLEEIRTWAAVLGARLDDLPRLTCRACAARLAGGSLAVDEHRALRGAPVIGGYGLIWEGINPPANVHLSIFQKRWLLGIPQRDQVAGVCTEPRLLREVLHWLTHGSGEPTHYQKFSAQELAHYTLAFVPGAGAPGTERWGWSGAHWEAPCPPLGGLALISLVCADPHPERLTLAEALTTWRGIDARIQRFALFGEQEDAGRAGDGQERST